MDYYTSEKVTDHLTAIKSLSGEIMYLIEGESEAVLIDTCVGVGHIRNYAEGITDKPITVLISHGHVDHAMGAPEFERVHMNSKDIGLYQIQCTLEERKEYVAAGIGAESAAEISDEEYVPVKPEQKFEALEDGMVFDLGGIHIDAYEFPGHTKGCMVFLVREEKILILGDACNNATFLFDDICSTVADYQKQLKKVSNHLEGKYDRVLLMHHFMDAPVSIMTEMSDLCDEILAGKADNIPFSFMGKEALIAKAANERFERMDGKAANLIYNPGRIR